ncbi:hypothetical protein F5884DRAFT_770220 [Xylogone sp. PMI_703]|nr:hypothetical protein F5884DRAFT_770220 [Xylogone sp. PMI_703]
MSYPPPPGLRSKSTSAHPSLPARPPPSSLPSPAFKPAYSSSPAYNNAGRGGTAAAPGGGYGYQSFAPRQVAAPQPTAPYQSYQQPGAGYGAQPYGQYNSAPEAYSTPPQIRNPFVAPSANPAPGEDPELAAQIAQWQSAYAPKDTTDNARGYRGATAATSANATALGGASHTSAVPDSSTDAAAAASGGADGSQKTVVRSGGGTQWTDSTLLEWDPAHFRLFVGNLAGEVTDDSLYKAFSRWPSLQKARVIRDKRTTKSKGYGFVSFSDGDDFFKAAREMQGKYIGSHPVLLRRATTEIKAVTPRDSKNKGKGKGGKFGSNGHGGSGGSKSGAGVQKAGSKTKGGLRVLG